MNAADDTSSTSERGIVVERDVSASALIVGDHNRVTLVSPDVARPAFALVPPRPTMLLGRDQLLGELKRALGVRQSHEFAETRRSQTSVVALTGMPGVGKSALASALVYEKDVREHFAGGVLWAALGQSPNLDEVLNRWGEALGVDVSEEAKTDTRCQRVQVALRGRPFLIVLDDVWMPDDAIGLLNVAGPGCAHLLTTRDDTIARRFAPQAVNLVDELSDDDAVALLVALGPDLVSRNEARLRRVVKSVGGLPLALTLVAGYLTGKVFFASQATAALDESRDSELWLGLRDLDRRLSLSEVISLSVGSLAAEGQVSFARMGAFAAKPSDFSLDAARKVRAMADTVLGELVRRHLLDAVSTEDRVMLHQCLAAAAAQQGQLNGTLIEAKRCHAEYYQEWVNTNSDAWRLIERELPQIRFAWTWVSGAVGNDALVVGYARALRPFQNVCGMRRSRGPSVP